jgi:hypothetical protein
MKADPIMKVKGSVKGSELKVKVKGSVLGNWYLRLDMGRGMG